MKYFPEIFLTTLKAKQFPDYYSFKDINLVCRDFMHQVSSVINLVGPLKEFQFKTWQKLGLIGKSMRLHN